MNKKIGAVVLALGLMQVGGVAMAEPSARPPFSLGLSCLRHNGTIYPGVVPAGQKGVIYGPYSTKCGRIAHIFYFGILDVNVEQLINGSWKTVVNKQSTVNSNIGSGTFRVVYDNRASTLPRSYKGSFSVPL
ncbi:MAG: hypothetical protein JWQ69_2556 [Pseudomonas sp.]|nr:hypothetical protein [Pseudomonas sp.]